MSSGGYSLEPPQRGATSPWRDHPALSLTWDIVEPLMRALTESYMRGGLQNHFREVGAKKGRTGIRPWKPADGKVEGGAYTLGMYASYDFNGTHGPQYKLTFQVGSDRFAGTKQRIIDSLREDAASAVLANALSSPAIADVLASRGVEPLDRLSSADLMPWLSVTTGKYARLLGGRKKNRSGSVLFIGDQVRNATAPDHSRGCISAFVRGAGKGHLADEPLQALSAAHVITNNGRATPGTSVKGHAHEPARNIGTYRHPHPFQLSGNQIVTEDAGLAELLPGWKASNRMSFKSRRYQLSGPLAADNDALATGEPACGVVGREQAVKKVNIFAVGAQETLLDADDQGYVYGDLIVLQDSRNSRQQEAGPLVVPGDSGALVFRLADLETDKAVKRPLFQGMGYIVGGQLGREGGSLAYCMRLDRALAVLQVEVAK